MCLQYIDIKQKKLKQFYHNPRVGGSSPSSATNFFPKILILDQCGIPFAQKMCLFQPVKKN